MATASHAAGLELRQTVWDDASGGKRGISTDLRCGQAPGAREGGRGKLAEEWIDLGYLRQPGKTAAPRA